MAWRRREGFSGFPRDPYFARDDGTFCIDISGRYYYSNREMHCLSLLATLLVPVMVSIVSAKESPPAPQEFDVVIRNGTVYDGSGGEGRQADVALRGDRIAGVGDYVFPAATPSGDRLVLAGGYRGTLDIGTGPLPSAGETDAFVAALLP